MSIPPGFPPSSGSSYPQDPFDELSQIESELQKAFGPQANIHGPKGAGSKAKYPDSLQHLCNEYKKATTLKKKEMIYQKIREELESTTDTGSDQPPS